MCDYSLMNFPNRLANEGEVLVTHKFSTGSIGFVSRVELSEAIQPNCECANTTFWSKVKGWFATTPACPSIPAICVPPGARLKVRCVPVNLRHLFRVEPGYDVVFTEISATWGQFRDGLRIRGRQEILLQSLGEGLEVQVMDLASSQDAPGREEYMYSLVPRR